MLRAWLATVLAGELLLLAGRLLTVGREEVPRAVVITVGRTGEFKAVCAAGRRPGSVDLLGLRQALQRDSRRGGSRARSTAITARRPAGS